MRAIKLTVVFLGYVFCLTNVFAAGPEPSNFFVHWYNSQGVVTDNVLITWLPDGDHWAADYACRHGDVIVAKQVTAELKDGVMLYSIPNTPVTKISSYFAFSQWIPNYCQPPVGDSSVNKSK